MCCPRRDAPLHRIASEQCVKRQCRQVSDLYESMEVTGAKSPVATTTGWGRHHVAASLLAPLRAAMFGLVCLAGLAAGAAPASAADYPDPPGQMADRLHRRRPGRYRGADHGAVAVGAFRPAIRGGEPRRLRRQHRRGRGDQLAAGRLYAAVRRAQQRDLDLALQEAAVRLHPRHRAGRQHHAADQHDGGAECDCRSKPSRSSSTTARPIRARSPLPRPATAPRCTCRRNCSRR